MRQRADLDLGHLGEAVRPEHFHRVLRANGDIGKLNIDFKLSDKKRSDSPTNTDFYSLKFNNTDLLNSIKSNEYFELTTSNNKTELKKVLVWQFYEYKTQQ